MADLPAVPPEAYEADDLGPTREVIRKFAAQWDEELRRAHELGVAEGRRQAAEAIRAEDVQLHASATMEWAARIAEGNTDA